MDADDRVAATSLPIFHVATELEWSVAQNGQLITPESLASEGFVHCSTAAQLDGVLARFYAGRDDIWILAIDPDLLGVDVEVRWEAPAHPDGSPNTDAEDHERFPHVYGPVPVAAVISAERPAPRR